MSYLALIVEDANRQYVSLESELKSGGWNVVRAMDKEDALFRLRTLKEENTYLDAAAIDLGLPPDQDDIQVGLQLIHNVRKLSEYEDLPILAYTSQSHIDYVQYASAVRQLLTLKASLIYLRPLEGSFANVMSYIRQGFVLLSPTPAAYLPNAVPEKPDPLEAVLWETLENLSYGLSHPQAARQLSISQETIRSRMDKVRQQLIEKKEIPLDARQEEMLDWYREHMVRYAREKNLDVATRPKRKRA